MLELIKIGSLNEEASIKVSYEVDSIISWNQQFADFETGRQMSGCGQIYFCHNGNIAEKAEILIGRDFQQINLIDRSRRERWELRKAFFKNIGQQMASIVFESLAVKKIMDVIR